MNTTETYSVLITEIQTDVYKFRQIHDVDRYALQPTRQTVRTRAYVLTFPTSDKDDANIIENAHHTVELSKRSNSSNNDNNNLKQHKDQTHPRSVLFGF